MRFTIMNAKTRKTTPPPAVILTRTLVMDQSASLGV